MHHSTGIREDTPLTEAGASRTSSRRGRKKPHDPPSKLARAVRAARDQKGWTSEQLSEATKRLDPKGKGVSHSWVRNFEIGIIQNPGADTIQLLEEAMDLRVGELYAAAIPIPYDKLVDKLLVGQDGRKAPWDKLMAGQALILKEVRTLARRLSPSSAIDQGAVEELVEHAVEQGIREGRARAALPPEADGA